MPVGTLVAQPDGKILVGGSFFGTNSIGGQRRTLIARLDPVTGQADSFDPNANQAQCCLAPYVYAIAVQADGKVLAGGDFLGLAPNGGPQITRNHIVRLETDGRADQTLNLKWLLAMTFVATAIQPDGKMVIGGKFTSILGVARNNIARLNTDGTLDMAFDPNSNGGEVLAIAVQADGKIVVSGNFTEAASAERRAIALRGSMPYWRGGFVRSECERAGNLHCNAAGREDFVRWLISPASADNRAITSRVSTPTPVWPIRSIPARTALSIPSRCRRTGKSSRVVGSPYRRSEAGTPRPARWHDRPGRCIRPERG